MEQVPNERTFPSWRSRKGPAQRRPGCCVSEEVRRPGKACCSAQEKTLCSAPGGGAMSKPEQLPVCAPRRLGGMSVAGTPYCERLPPAEPAPVKGSKPGGSIFQYSIAFGYRHGRALMSAWIRNAIRWTVACRTPKPTPQSRNRVRCYHASSTKRCKSTGTWQRARWSLPWAGCCSASIPR